MTNTFSTTGGTSHSDTVTGLSNGNTYSHYVRCNDTEGNYNTDDLNISFSIASSSTIPTVNLNTPLNSALLNTQSVTFNCSASSANNLRNITLYGNWSGWHANETKSVTGTSNSTTFVKTIPDGSYKWNCLAYDNSSNSSFALSNYTFAIDSTPPSTPTNLQATAVSSSQINLSWNASTDNIGIAGYRIYRNSTQVGTSPTSFYQDTGLSPSTTYAYMVSAYDLVGHNSSNSTIALATTKNASSGSISTCGNLDVENQAYMLIANVSSAGTCFNILANNVTLDGAGYTINYSYSTVGYAVNNTDGYDNITIKNCNIVQGNGSTYTAYAIYGSGMANSMITNNSINTSGGNGYGIYLRSSSNSNIVSNNTITTIGNYGYGVYIFSASNSNNLSNNKISTTGNFGHGIHLSSSITNTISNSTITTSGSSGYGIYLYTVSNNTISGGSIISNRSYDYYLQNADTTNNFTETNFTAAREIYFYDTSSWFNYNNQSDGNIWLRTNVSAASWINRTLASWTNAVLSGMTQQIWR